MTMNKVFERVSAIIEQKNDNFCGLNMSYTMNDDFGEDTNPALKTWYVSLKWIDEGNKRHQIADATIHVVDIEMCDWETAIEAFDEQSESMVQLALATQEAWENSTRIFAIDLVQVEEEYRGNGIAPVLVSEVLTRLCGETEAMAVLEVGCIGWEDMSEGDLKTATKKTADSWKRAGFSKVKGKGDYYSLHWNKFSVAKTANRVMKHLEKKVSN